MRVALCFSGQPRTFEECWPSFQRYLLNKYEVDVFGASAPCETLLKYPFKKLLFQEDELIDEKDYNSRKREETSVQNTLRQFYFIELANRLRIEYEADKQFKYDVIIRTRFDDILTGDLPDLLNCQDNTIYIPSGHDHPLIHLNLGIGISDRFAFGGDQAINAYCNKLSLIPQYMTCNEYFHPETMLKWMLVQSGVNIVRFDECVKVNKGNNVFF